MSTPAPTPLPLFSAPTTIANTGNDQVVLVGGANMDLTACALRPLTPGDSTPGQIQWAPGGVARNVAENLARLGVASHLVSLVGDDLFGKNLLDATRNAGVNVSAIGRRADQRTATYLSVHGPDGEVAMAVNDMAILEGLTPDHLQSQQALLQSAACIVLDCNLAPTALDWFFTQSLRSPVFVDGVSMAKCLRVQPWLSQIHMLKVNALEAAELTGRTVQSVPEACLAAVHLHQSGVRSAVISLGKHGVCWCDEHGRAGHRAASDLPVVNTSGAGDALLAGLVHGHLNQMPLPQAIEFAMICAEITLASPCANAPQLSLAAVHSVLLPTNRALKTPQEP